MGSGTQGPHGFNLSSKWDPETRKARRGYRINCCECTRDDFIAPNNAAGTLPPDMLVKKFQEKGWLLGPSRNRDLCPSCQEAIRKDREKREELRKALHADAEKRLAAMPKPPRKAADFETDDRRVLVLMDRANDIYVNQKRDEAAIELLIDSIANSTKLMEDIFAEIRELTGREPITIDDQRYIKVPVFTTLPPQKHVGPKIMQNKVEIAHYHPRTVITITSDICKKLGLPDVGNRIEIAPGLDEPDLMRIRASDNEDFAFKGYVDPRGHTRVHLQNRPDLFRPQIAGTTLPVTPVRFALDPEDQERSLVFIKPPFFVAEAASAGESH